MKCVILTLYTDEIKEVSAISLPNKHAYAKKMGTTIGVCKKHIAPSRPPSWSKIAMLDIALRDSKPNEWAMWMDCDAMFMRADVDFRQWCDPGYDLVICEAYNGINAGVFFAKNSLAMKAFIARVWKRTDLIDHPWWEQQAMIEELAKHDCPIKARQIRGRDFNAFLHPCGSCIGPALVLKQGHSWATGSRVGSSGGVASYFSAVGTGANIDEAPGLRRR